MKIASPNLPSHRFIDTAPLRSRYDVLAEAVLAFVTAGRLGHAIRTSHRIMRLIQTLTTLDGHNTQLRRKLDMLSHKLWRDCVLRELGGMRKLKLWEVAYGRILMRASAPVKATPPQEPSWLYTPARIAESERLKARARHCMRAAHNPLIVRDRVRVDFEGEFRLAPLPRGKRAARQMKVYTENTIVDYDWNPTPIAKEKGFGPASVWPVDFYAAMAIEAQSDRNRDNSNHLGDTITTERRSHKTSDIKTQRPSSSSFQVPLRGPGMTDKKTRKSAVPKTPLHQALSPKEYPYFFGSLTS